MKLRVLACVLSLALAPALAFADDSVVNNSAQSLVLACGEGGTVAINGSNNEITVTGSCSKVTINGATNDVELEAVDRIAVNGAGNTVVWQRGWKLKAPKVTKRGRNNRVTRAE